MLADVVAIIGTMVSLRLEPFYFLYSLDLIPGSGVWVCHDIRSSGSEDADGLFSEVDR